MATEHPGKRNLTLGCCFYNLLFKVQNKPENKDNRGILGERKGREVVMESNTLEGKFSFLLTNQGDWLWNIGGIAYDSQQQKSWSPPPGEEDMGLRTSSPLTFFFFFLMF